MEKEKKVSSLLEWYDSLTPVSPLPRSEVDNAINSFTNPQFEYDKSEEEEKKEKEPEKPKEVETEKKVENWLELFKALALSKALEHKLSLLSGEFGGDGEEFRNKVKQEIKVMAEKIGKIVSGL